MINKYKVQDKLRDLLTERRLKRKRIKESLKINFIKG